MMVFLNYFLINSVNIPAGNSISVSHDTAGIGTVINTLVPSFIDNGHDYDYIRYRQNSGPGNSYIHGTSDLFYLDTCWYFQKVIIIIEQRKKVASSVIWEDNIMYIIMYVEIIT
jgi:hypothetical protein